ncbi:uncharacterized protein BO80DRAFT_428766 [Aspergillus ibericus CBS 121593]|uniref:Transmembrane protein n=1 Tax=Aspergillus ibericus CBS 121593 TaxID=1448316 RepID=A0A395GRR2_9EURO|nr:hypothetical protein BO80DRAFT_428766 [Aspergillus ibericus CBS 121593]RAK96763.1 hypothetical protein BO80DRAFT_428766 [Aspergillus ibericus CBS 121593]
MTRLSQDSTTTDYETRNLLSDTTESPKSHYRLWKTGSIILIIISIVETIILSILLTQNTSSTHTLPKKDISQLNRNNLPPRPPSPQPYPHHIRRRNHRMGSIQSPRLHNPPQPHPLQHHPKQERYPRKRKRVYDLCVSSVTLFEGVAGDVYFSAG